MQTIHVILKKGGFEINLSFKLAPWANSFMEALDLYTVRMNFEESYEFVNVLG